MTKVKLVTFKGCQHTIDFCARLKKLIETEEVDIGLETIRAEDSGCLVTARDRLFYGIIPPVKAQAFPRHRSHD
jgi:hypothetical protein